MRYSKNQEAFTLIEILIVSVVIGILALMFGRTLMSRWEKIKINQTKTILASVKNAMIEYQVDTGKVPKTMDDMLKYFPKNEPPADAWGNEIIFNKPPQRYTQEFKKFELYSPGPSEDEDETEDNIYIGE